MLIGVFEYSDLLYMSTILRGIKDILEHPILQKSAPFYILEQRITENWCNTDPLSMGRIVRLHNMCTVHMLSLHYMMFRLFRSLYIALQNSLALKRRFSHCGFNLMLYH